MSGRRIALAVIVGLTALAGAARADRVAYQGQFVVGVQGVMVMTEGGKDPVVLPQVKGAGEDNITPSLSSDGTRVAFAAKKEGHWQIFVWPIGAVDQPVGEPTQVTSGERDYLLPVWSPDDIKIAYVVGTDGAYALFVFNADGSNPIRLADLTATYEGASPTWSADGSRIAFSREGQLWLVSSDGQGLEKLRDDGSYPSWSPDGSTIAYLERAPAPALATVTPDGERRHLLLKGIEGFGGVSWGPGARRLLFKAASVAGKPGKLWVINADGTSLRPMKSYGTAQGPVAWKALAKGAALPVPTPVAKEPSEVQPVVLLSPAPDAEVRGRVQLIATKRDPGGYVIFRAGDKFLYATASPFQFQWDTRRVTDGPVRLDAVGYDTRAELEGQADITVTVRNAIAESEIPPQGLLLRAGLKRDAGWVSQILGVSNISGGSQVEATQLAALDDRLTAELRQTIEDVAGDGSSATIAARLESGTLRRAGQEVPLPMVKRSARETLLSTGLIKPIFSRSGPARIGLGELSIGLPPTPVKLGDQWNATLVTITDLATTNVIELPARHTIEGLQWYGEQRAVRIRSTYTASQIVLSLPGVALMAPTPEMGAPYAPTPYAPIAPRRIGSSRDDDEQEGGPPPTAPPPPAGQPAMPTGIILTDVSGQRTTWFAYETGRVLRIEETLQARVQTGAEPVSYTFSLEVSSQPAQAATY